MSITGAFFERLSSDTTLISLLSSYQGTAAVFTAQPIPSDAILPYIVSVGQVSDIPVYDTKNRNGNQAERDIRIYTQANGSMSLLEQIGEQVWTLFHRQPLTIAGWDNLVVSASRPRFMPIDEHTYGMIVSVTMINQQN